MNTGRLQKTKINNMLLRATAYVAIGAFLFNTVYIEQSWAKEENLKPVVSQDRHRVREGIAAFVADLFLIKHLKAYLAGEKAVGPDYHKELENIVARNWSQRRFDTKQARTDIALAVPTATASYVGLSELPLLKSMSPVRSSALTEGEKFWKFDRISEANKIQLELRYERYSLLNDRLGEHYDSIQNLVAEILPSSWDIDDEGFDMRRKCYLWIFPNGNTRILAEGVTNDEEILERIIAGLSGGESEYASTFKPLWEATGHEFWAKAVKLYREALDASSEIERFENKFFKVANRVGYGSMEERLEWAKAELFEPLQEDHFFNILKIDYEHYRHNPANEHQIIRLLRSFVAFYDNDVSKEISELLRRLDSEEIPDQRKILIFSALELLLVNSDTMHTGLRTRLRILAQTYVWGDGYVMCPYPLSDEIESVDTQTFIMSMRERIHEGGILRGKRRYLASGDPGVREHALEDTHWSLTQDDGKGPPQLVPKNIMFHKGEVITVRMQNGQIAAGRVDSKSNPVYIYLSEGEEAAIIEYAVKDIETAWYGNVDPTRGDSGTGPRMSPVQVEEIVRNLTDNGYGPEEAELIVENAIERSGNLRSVYGRLTSVGGRRDVVMVPILSNFEAIAVVLGAKPYSSIVLTDANDRDIGLAKPYIEGVLQTINPNIRAVVTSNTIHIIDTKTALETAKEAGLVTSDVDMVDYIIHIDLNDKKAIGIMYGYPEGDAEFYSENPTDETTLKPCEIEARFAEGKILWGGLGDEETRKKVALYKAMAEIHDSLVEDELLRGIRYLKGTDRYSIDVNAAGDDFGPDVIMQESNLLQSQMTTDSTEPDGETVSSNRYINVIKEWGPYEGGLEYFLEEEELLHSQGLRPFFGVLDPDSPREKALKICKDTAREWVNAVHAGKVPPSSTSDKYNPKAQLLLAILEEQTRKTYPNLGTDEGHNCLGRRQVAWMLRWTTSEIEALLKADKRNGFDPHICASPAELKELFTTRVLRSTTVSAQVDSNSIIMLLKSAPPITRREPIKPYNKETQQRLSGA